jgi:hypothetical protein
MLVSSVPILLQKTSLSRQQQMQTTVAEATTLSRKLPNAEPNSRIAGVTATVAHRCAIDAQHLTRLPLAHRVHPNA